MKQLNQEIEANLEELRNRINEIQDNPFKNVKVRQLWDKVTLALLKQTLFLHLF